MANEIAQVDLDSLLGEHKLSGVDMAVEKVKRYDDSFEDANACRFRLDGKVYTAIEDPSDGYRSSMDKLFLGGKVKNRFPPIRVVGTKRPDGYHKNDVVVFVDVKTGKPVLEVGTDNTDDYYPSFVAAFHPENMATNAA